MRFASSSLRMMYMIVCVRSTANAGNHDHAAALGDAIDDVRQRVLRRIGRMVAVSVRRFAQQHIAARRRFRILQNRLAVAAHIAGKQHDGFLAVFRDGEFQARRAEDVARVVRAHGKLRRNRERIRRGEFRETLSAPVRHRPACKAATGDCACCIRAGAALSASSSCRCAESGSRILHSSIVAASAKIGPRKPSRTRRGR